MLQVGASMVWRGDGAAERAGLENRRPRKGSASSNLAPSAICNSPLEVVASLTHPDHPIMGRLLIWIGFFVGSWLGSLVPGLWGSGDFSLSSLFCSALGGMAGILGGWKLGRGV